MGKTNARLDRQFGRVVSGLARPWRLRPTEQQCTFFNPRWGAKTICVKPFVLQCVPKGAMLDWRVKRPKKTHVVSTSETDCHRDELVEGWKCRVPRMETIEEVVEG